MQKLDEKIVFTQNGNKPMKMTEMFLDPRQERIFSNPTEANNRKEIEASDRSI